MNIEGYEVPKELEEFIEEGGDYRSFPLYSLNIEDLIKKKDMEIKKLKEENKEFRIIEKTLRSLLK